MGRVLKFIIAVYGDEGCTPHDSIMKYYELYEHKIDRIVII